MSDKPIYFLAGLPRSGSTLLARTLAIQAMDRKTSGQVTTREP